MGDETKETIGKILMLVQRHSDVLETLTAQQGRMIDQIMLLERRITYLEQKNSVMR